MAATLDLDRLKNGRVGVSPVYGAFLAEAAAYCLKFNNHLDPVDLYVTGDDGFTAGLRWSAVGRWDGSTWADLQEATEYGAYGVAIVVTLLLTNASHVERSAKGTGIDYWVGSGDSRGIFQRSARLEVSGILKGDRAKIKDRLREKLAQTDQSIKSGLSAHVAIVEFSNPEVMLVKKMRITL
jgi:hypothetical protein